MNTHNKKKNLLSSVVLMCAMLLLIITGCDDNSSITGPERATLDGEEARTTSSSEHKVYWEGHGIEHIEDCETGYHWILTPAHDLTSVPLFFSEKDGEPHDVGEEMFRPSGNDDPSSNAAWHFNSGLVDTKQGETPYVTFDGDPHAQIKLIISHCLDDAEAEFLSVTKTVDTSFDREHDWSIDKDVKTEKEHTLNGEAKIWLWANGKGDETATWKVNVTYEGYDDGDHNVSGEIVIINTGNLDAVITGVEDVLGGTTIDVDCGVTFNYTLEVGESLTCTYDEDGLFEGNNVATVTTLEDTYSATEPIVWGDPTTETHQFAYVTDTNDGFALAYGDENDEVVLDAHDYEKGDIEKFKYSQAFAYEDYDPADCEDGDKVVNTAEVRGDDDELLDDAKATLLINIQCVDEESAWAMGVGGIGDVTAYTFCDNPFNNFNNWGWTNLISDPYLSGSEEEAWPLWAGAGQCDTSKATLVGYFTVEYDSGADVFTYQFHIFDEFLYDEDDEAVYAGSDPFPSLRNGRYTTAPGQYDIDDNLSSDIFVIAHTNVGIPDPDFGP